jgi:hypothetical protein
MSKTLRGVTTIEREILGRKVLGEEETRREDGEGFEDRSIRGEPFARGGTIGWTCAGSCSIPI